MCAGPIQSYLTQKELPRPSHFGPLPEGRPNTICIDKCLVDEITALWERGIITTGCCCGHGQHDGYIGVVDEHIGMMKELGYEVSPNPCRPGDEDSFYPKMVVVVCPVILS